MHCLCFPFIEFSLCSFCFRHSRIYPVIYRPNLTDCNEPSTAQIDTQPVSFSFLSTKTELAYKQKFRCIALLPCKNLKEIPGIHICQISPYLHAFVRFRKGRFMQYAGVDVYICVLYLMSWSSINSVICFCFLMFPCLS